MTAPHPQLLVDHEETNPLVLVSGAAGFLGFGLCQKLLSQNCRVFAFDNFATGRKENIRKLATDPHFTFFEHDLAKPLPAIPAPDYIFHLAGVAEYPEELNVTLDTLLVNSLGTQHLLALVKKSAAKFLLGSAVSVFSGFLSQEKILEDPISAHHEAKRFAETLTAEYFHRFNLDCRIVRFLDLYGPRMNLESASEIAQLFKAVQKGDNLSIKGDGLKYLYPVFLEDAVAALLRAMFSPYSRGKIFNLAGSQKVTVFAFAQILQRKLPHRPKIVHLKEGESFAFSAEVRPDLDWGWEPKVDLEEGTRETLTWLLEGKETSQERKESPEKILPPPKVEEKVAGPESSSPRRKTSFKKLALLILAGLFAFAFLFKVFYPAVGATWDIFWGLRDLETIQKGKSLSLKDLADRAQRAENHFRVAQEELANFDWLLSDKIQNEWRGNLALAQDFSLGTKHALKLGQSLKQIFKITLGKESGDIGPQIIQAQEELEAAEQNWAQVQAQLKFEKSESQFLGMVSKKKVLKEKLPAYRQILGQTRQLLAVMPDVMGLRGERNYLLLLQNNTELRPTGGFIGSYGLLSFDKGQLRELKIEDVYSADGQLRGHVEPPAPIKKYLKEHWFLRDSNWDPDFSQSAQKAEWFLEKEIGQKVEGVIGFDLVLAQKILEAAGPVALPDYQETINAQNLFEKAEKYSEIEFFPGSTQKKDFLGALNRRLLEKLTTEENLPWSQVLTGFTQALKEKHLLLYFHDPLVQKLVAEAHFSGQIEKPQGDFLMINEANFGLNKANYFLKRQITSEVTIGKMAEISRRLILNFENKSPVETWPGGAYRSFLRVYVPLGSRLTNLAIDGALATQSAETASESGKTVFSFYFEVPAKSQKEIAFAYILPQKLPFELDKGSYEFYFQKQPGTLNDPLNVVINYPSYLRVAKSEPQGNVGEQKLILATDTATDQKFSVEFRK